MSLFNENTELIQKIEKYINELEIPVLEQKIKNESIEDISVEEDINKKFNQLYRIKSRIMAVNEKVINEHSALRDRFVNVDAFLIMPCSIVYMDVFFNTKIYPVQKYYQKLFDKYKDNPTKFILLGLMPNMQGRLLKIDYLEEKELQEAQVMDMYLKLCFLEESYEMLIDCIKCIQFSYLQEDIQE